MDLETIEIKQRVTDRLSHSSLGNSPRQGPTRKRPSLRSAPPGKDLRFAQPHPEKTFASLSPTRKRPSLRSAPPGKDLRFAQPHPEKTFASLSPTRNSPSLRSAPPGKDLRFAQLFSDLPDGLGHLHIRSPSISISAEVLQPVVHGDGSWRA